MELNSDWNKGNYHESHIGPMPFEERIRAAIKWRAKGEVRQAEYIGMSTPSSIKGEEEASLVVVLRGGSACEWAEILTFFACSLAHVQGRPFTKLLEIQDYQPVGARLA